MTGSTGRSVRDTGNGQYRVVVADDHQIVRSGLRSALETPGLVEPNGLAVVEEAADGLSAIAAVKRHQPDLLLLDVQMPHAGGIEVVVEARRWSAGTRIVIFTGVTAAGLIGELVEAGVEGLFSKSSDTGLLYEKLPLVLRGGRFIAPEFLSLLESRPDHETLTDRERQTLNMILAGRANKEIADAFGISVKTVEKHRTSLMQKLKVHSMAQLLAVALKNGLIDRAPEL
ncbi:MAG: response regulator transcription factor [Pseudomonadota bacterium]